MVACPAFEGKLHPRFVHPTEGIAPTEHVGILTDIVRRIAHLGTLHAQTDGKLVLVAAVPVGTLLLAYRQALARIVEEHEEVHLARTAHRGIEQLEGSLVGIGGYVESQDGLLFVVVDCRIVVKAKFLCRLPGNLLIAEDGVRAVERVVITMGIGLRLHVLDDLIPHAKVAAATCHTIGVEGREVGNMSSP